MDDEVKVNQKEDSVTSLNRSMKGIPFVHQWDTKLENVIFWTFIGGEVEH